MPTRVWRSSPQKELQAQGAVLDFGFTRTSFRSARVQEIRLEGTLEVGEELELTFHLRGTRAVAWASREVRVSSTSRLELEVEYEGEEPILIGVRWLRLNGPDEPELEHAPFLPSWWRPGGEGTSAELEAELRVDSTVQGTAPPADADAPLELLGEGDPRTDVGEYLDARDSAIELTARVLRFFAALDRATDPLTFGGPSLQHCQFELESNARRRVALALNDYAFSFVPNKSLSGSLKSIATVFDAAMMTAGLTEEELPWAFELFVSGRLSAAHPDPALRKKLASHGAPNSWFYFLFAELAIACARGDAWFFDQPTRERWAKRVPFLVRCGHLLAEFAWGSIQVNGAPVTPYAYFDGFAMRLELVEGARAVYEGSLDAEASGAVDPVAVWENAQGALLALAEVVPSTWVFPLGSPLLRDLSFGSLPKLQSVTGP